MPSNAGNPAGNKQAPTTKPMHECGEVGSYGTQKRKSKAKKKGAKRNTFERDHVPSKAAIVRKAMTKPNGTKRTMSKKKAKCVNNRCRDRAQSIAIPAGHHREYSPTCGSKNTATQIANDAKDLEAARDRDLKAMQKAMDGPPKHKCADAYRAAAEEIRTFDNDAMIAQALKDCGVK